MHASHVERTFAARLPANNKYAQRNNHLLFKIAIRSTKLQLINTAIVIKVVKVQAFRFN